MDTEKKAKTLKEAITDAVSALDQLERTRNSIIEHEQLYLQACDSLMRFKDHSLFPRLVEAGVILCDDRIAVVCPEKDSALVIKPNSAMPLKIWGDDLAIPLVNEVA